jgi:hypothetical protein
MILGANFVDLDQVPKLRSEMTHPGLLPVKARVLKAHSPLQLQGGRGTVRGTNILAKPIRDLKNLYRLAPRAVAGIRHVGGHWWVGEALL